MLLDELLELADHLAVPQLGNRAFPDLQCQAAELVCLGASARRLWKGGKLVVAGDLLPHLRRVDLGIEEAFVHQHVFCRVAGEVGDCLLPDDLVAWADQVWNLDRLTV